ncbi:MULTISPECIES: TetR/AcrR family transcriptional regulator [Actinopolyspora]|uniref:DNA-binding transcriptional regulator, AcrR family n=1 Tax=Actinopolyspora saharensis TaxID=995062 RepID=A0A1H1G0C6_9ACTN|nr:TetR/AcrR family transcriptional regulator [Actinopolyspora saharensis]NHD16269.1 TetR/AcrR family transcriptional regulator [Actinopolyspora sp. BKK2]NHE75868.1 TetR/AcrR family transcriptional regulator [Actinopolyspora sp. BKK1]SDR06620.1 DNA-binding transcriptional regulator, AcrR family [Actinopolyspora saharensis]
MQDARRPRAERSETPAKPRSRRLPRQVRERQILDAAVEVFARHGYHEAAMDEISDAAEISKPMIYTYLGSKEELFVACIRREANRLIDSIGQAVEANLSPDEQLWRGLRAFFEYANENRASWTVLHRQARTQGQPFTAELSEWRQRALDLVTGLLARASGTEQQPVPHEQVQPFAAALVGAGESMLDWWFDHPEYTADALSMRLMNLVWMGFGDMVQGRRWKPGGD